MAKFEVKNPKKFEELIHEVGNKYGLELNYIQPNFIGGNNAYCGNEILKAINCNSLPILHTDGFLLGEDSVHVTFYLILHTDIGKIKTPLYSDILKLSEIGGVYYNAW